MKKYEMIVIESNHKVSIKRTNRGFNAMELVGYHWKAINEILKMVDGEMEVDEVKTTAIVKEDKDEIKQNNNSRNKSS